MTEEEIEAAIGDAHYLLDEAMPDQKKIHEGEIERSKNDYFVLLDPDANEWLVTKALNGSRRAHDDLCELAERITSEGRALPLWLQKYAVLAMPKGQPPAKRGRKVEDYNTCRDAAITWATFVVVLRHDLKPTRNPAARRRVESGCSIVLKALKKLGIYMVEDNVNKIWRSGVGPDLWAREKRFANSFGPNLWILGKPLEYLVYLRQTGMIAEAGEWWLSDSNVTDPRGFWGVLERRLCHIRQLKPSDLPHEFPSTS